MNVTSMSKNPHCMKQTEMTDIMNNIQNRDCVNSLQTL